MSKEIEDKATEEVEFDADVFESMVSGSFEVPSEEEDDASEDVDSTEDTVEETESEDFEEEDNENQEDTDQEDESEDEEELDEESDGDLDEDLDAEDEDEEEDTLVDDNDTDDEDSDTTEDEEDTDEVDSEDEDNADTESEDTTETEEPSDGEAQETDGVDYKAFYEAVVNTEFVVNGRKTKGFADPQKIIQSQQMAGGFSEKMAGFKQYRPFMAPLKDRGMLDDPAKFDLAMNLLDGDTEAIKQHLQSLDIDPMELDMDKIQYDRKATTASQEAINIEDAMERARRSGVEDKVRHVVGKEWDSESFNEFATNEHVRNDLLTHIETGLYDKVQDKMGEMSRLDYNGAFGNMSSINKYKAAVRELAEENKQAPIEVVKPTPVKKAVPKKPTVNTEKAKIEKARKEEEYKVKAAKREAKLTQQRKKAASMSKKKSKVTKPKAKFDPMKVEGKELDNLMDFLISGNRG